MSVGIRPSAVNNRPSSPDPTYNLVPLNSANVHDSVSHGLIQGQAGGPLFDQQDPFSRLVIVTAATNVTVEQVLDTAAGGIDGTGSTGLLVNGAAQGDGAGMTALGGPQLFTYSGLGTGNKTLEFINGPAANLSFGGTQRSVQILGVRIPSAFGFTVVAPSAPAKRIIVDGTSITVGQAASVGPHLSTTYQCTFMLMRANVFASSSGSWAGARLMVVGAGSKRWFDIAGDATKRSAYVSFISARCNGTSANLLILDGLETNDYGSAAWSAASLETAVGTLIDAIHTALPSLVIMFVTATTRTNETVANGAGSTLPNYRTSVTNIQSARPSYCSLVSGPTLTSSLMPDGVHLTTTGQSEKEAGLRTPLGY